jgi:hypothetical protein
MTLQHFTANEGALYAASHAKAFVSRFNETAGTWNMTADPISPPVTPGVITTTAPMALAATTYMDVAAAPAGTQLFAGLVSEEQLVCQQALTVFTGERLSTLKVQLNWVVASLTNLGRMIIEKDVYNNGNWLPVDSLLPTSATAYTYTDTTAYSNTTSAYRIRMNCNIGGYVYADRILVAPPERASDPVLMYPNPASVIINVAIPDYQRYITLAVYDLTGHLLIRQQIFGPVTPVNVSALPGGSYNIFLLTPDNKVTGNLRMIKVN